MLWTLHAYHCEIAIKTLHAYHCEIAIETLHAYHCEIAIKHINLHDTSLHLCLQINTIAAVRHSATEGHTVVMTQTDAVHESFYDLFNRRFHRIDATSGPRYYANIAIGAHIKPCRVHPDFECIVMVKESELKDIPPPFLNRFEKYLLSHEQVLEAALNHLPPCLTLVLRTALDKVSAPRWIIRWLTSSLLAFLIT